MGAHQMIRRILHFPHIQRNRDMSAKPALKQIGGSCSNPTGSGMFSTLRFFGHESPWGLLPPKGRNTSRGKVRLKI